MNPNSRKSFEWMVYLQQRQLKAEGIIEREGPDKGGTWKVK
jgi:hypothetical protein